MTVPLSLKSEGTRPPVLPDGYATEKDGGVRRLKILNH